ncbi:7694_t:CDS:1 [Funneliformis mosseae]|uniref:7694_t:CDS:1 n=1 Tax=Funneliformis mosseae TaxID=27381 RepID=A0A9N9A5L0_FUNMO|nr:7694_t:CDS:1 [Funneliformis mosseae]
MTCLPVECIREILEYLYDDTISLHSCLLVNRSWCEITIPILWRNPFGRDLTAKRYILLINTYMSRLSMEERGSIDSTIEKSTFDYSTFLRVFDCEKILLAFRCWAIPFSSFSLFKPLIQHFIYNSPKFDRVDFKKNMLFNDNIFLFPGARQSFAKLRSCNFFGEYTKGLIDSCAGMANDIRYITFRCLEPQHSNGDDLVTSDSSMDGLAHLIRSQKHLKKIILSDGRLNTIFKNEVFDSLTTQSNTLTVIKFLSINFHERFPLDQLLTCKNLKVLKIVNCRNYGNEVIITGKTHQFRQLKAITFSSSRLPFELYRKLISLAGDSLQTVILMGKVFMDTPPLPNPFTNNNNTSARFNSISTSSSSFILEPFVEFCPNIKQILACVNESQLAYLPSLLRSCRNLKRLSLYDSKYQSRSFHTSVKDMQSINVEDLLARVGQSIPSSLIKFNINMNWNFSAEVFGLFLQNINKTSSSTVPLSDGTRKGMMVTRSIQLQRLSLQFCTCITDEHLEMFYKYPVKSLNTLKIRGAEGVSEDGFRKFADFFGDCVSVPQKFRK